MGKSPSIADLAKKDAEFRSYLESIQADLKKQSSDADAALQQKIDAFYTQSKYTDAKGLVSGLNFDFVHQQEFTLENMKSIVDAISKALFSSAAPPAGASVSADAAKAAEDALGPAVGEMANLEMYIAGKVFDVISNVILSFGSSTAVTFKTDVQSRGLGYGMQMFTYLSAESYQSKSFFNNEYIYEYLYVYDVRFSVQQAKSEMNQTLVELYEDQILTYKKRLEALLKQLGDGTLDPGAYSTTKKIFDDLITDTEAKVDALKKQALTATKSR